MADKRISDLGTLSSLQDDDLLIVTDVSTSETKKVTYATVKNGIAAGSGSLTDIVQDTSPQLGGNLDVNGQSITSASNGNIEINPHGNGEILLGTNTRVRSNLGQDYLVWNAPYSQEADLPPAATYHGMFAHVHGTGRSYFSHSGNWIKLRDENTTIVNDDIDAGASIEQSKLSLSITNTEIDNNAGIALSKLASSTADRVMISSGTGELTNSTVTSSTLAYLDVNSSIQTQLNNKQASHTNLTAISVLTSAADKGIQFTGSGTAGLFDLTTAGKALLDDADAATQRATLGLGTISTLAAPSGDVVGTTDTQSLSNKTITTIDEGITLTLHSTQPSTTANKLYANSTSLYFGTTDVLATGSGMASFTVSGDSGTSQSITNADNVSITGGTGVTTEASATDTITVAIDSTVATLTGTQTLENKTLTAPVISTITNTGTLTLPTSTGTVALTSDLTNYVTASSTSTFTNKTFDADATGNSITNIEDANIKSGAAIAQSKLNLAITTAEIDSATLVTQSDSIDSNDNETTIPTSAAVKHYVDTNAGGSTLSALSDTNIGTLAAGQTLLYDGSNSFDNQEINVMGITGDTTAAAFTASLPLFFGAHLLTVSAVSGTSDSYTFSGWNSDGSDASDPTIYLISGHTYVFHLEYGNSNHPFAIRTGGSTTQAGSNLTTSNGGSNLIHIDTNGTVTTGTSANQKSQGWLIWKVPHFTANQKNSVGNYHYQCSQHNSMWGQFNIMSIQANGGGFGV
tara:strand:+ start:1811 stop:4051 length:2241 start_codon:yes stop_codon:yes gene_type:complete